MRLQLWDTAGQERFRSISKLYYRGASAVILVYSIDNESSFQEMGRWLAEVRDNVGEDVVVHVVGTKSDLVAEDPSLRKIPFERCIAYVAEHLYPQPSSTPPISTGRNSGMTSMDSKRSSGFWGQDIGWDCCHEISAKDGEGIDEVFRVITRKLVEQRYKIIEQDQAMLETAGAGRGQAGYFDRPVSTGSFRLGDKRRSWLGFPTPTIPIGEERIAAMDGTSNTKREDKKGKCC